MDKLMVKRMPSWWLVGCACLLATASAVAGQAEGPPSAVTTPPGGLRAELQAVRPMYRPDGPLRLRFTLINTSDEPADIELENSVSGDGGVGLPLELVLGTADEQALTVIFEDEEGKLVPAALLESPENGTRQLRLAPHGCLGADFDLRPYYQQARYPGSYRVEWRPLGGKLGVATAEFKVEPRKDAILVTDLGKLTFVLNYEEAPLNVQNFLELVRAGFYDGLAFHRVIPGFVIQGGCPKGDGTGMRADGKLVPAEFADRPFQTGTLAMARKPSNPNSASSQFFIGLARVEQLDGQYTIIGQASDEESLRTLQKLAEVPTDQKNRPVTPLTIRSINLVDAEQGRTLRLQYQGRKSTKPPSATSKRATQNEAREP